MFDVYVNHFRNCNRYCISLVLLCDTLWDVCRHISLYFVVDYISKQGSPSSSWSPVWLGHPCLVTPSRGGVYLTTLWLCTGPLTSLTNHLWCKWCAEIFEARHSESLAAHPLLLWAKSAAVDHFWAAKTTMLCYEKPTPATGQTTLKAVALSATGFPAECKHWFARSVSQTFRSRPSNHR